MDNVPMLEIIVEKEHFSIQDEVRYQICPYELLRHIMALKYPIKVTFKRVDCKGSSSNNFVYWQ
jgi:hypothetical protein